MNADQIEDFFHKYLALFGVDGGHRDYREIADWHMTGKYPSAFQKLWPLPVGKMYGYYPVVNGEAVAEQLANSITDPSNYFPAINSYRKQHGL